MTITMPYLRKVRTRQFIPVVELAERSGLTKMTIWRLERGRPAQMTTVRKLVTALGVEPRDLAVIHGEKEVTR